MVSLRESRDCRPLQWVKVEREGAALPTLNEKESPMRLIDGLTTIRTRLAENDADFTTLRFVDIYIKRAQGTDVSVPVTHDSR